MHVISIKQPIFCTSFYKVLETILFPLLENFPTLDAPVISLDGTLAKRVGVLDTVSQGGPLLEGLIDC